MNRHHTGFSLFELLATMAVAGIVLAIAIPNIGQFRASNRLTAAANDYLGSLQLARSEALRSQGVVSVCASANPADPNATCAAGPLSGWIVFADPNADCVRAPAEQLFGRGGPIEAAVTAVSNTACMSFAATGFMRTDGGLPANPRVVYCDAQGIGEVGTTGLSAARGVELAAPGRPRATRDVATITAWGLSCP
jgi:type IV fimbrial biogenesis protein FimT